MERGLILVMSDRPDRSKALADTVGSVAECVVIGADEGWERLDPVRGVIADVTLNRPEVKRSLRRLASHNGRAPRPLVFLTRGNSESAVAEARNLGATLCLSAYSEPRHVVGALTREIWPEKSLADLVVSREAARAGSLMQGLFTAAAADGRVDLASVEQSVDPVLKAIHEGSLTRWLDEVWTHDDRTFQHCLLVSGVAATFAQNLRLSTSDQQLLTRAALVHDVGKSKIPLAILNKPGRLDDDEMVVMRTHAPLGYDILKASGGCDPITLGVTRHHHEMLDGSGYPDGLSSDAIADPVRLLTICDIYAALVERRPYKTPMSTPEALGILQGMNGRLEGGLVQAFGKAVHGTP